MLHSIGFWNFQVICLASQNVLKCWWFLNVFWHFLKRNVTLKYLNCSMVMGAEHMSKFAVLSLTVENMFEKNEKPYSPLKDLIRKM